MYYDTGMWLARAAVAVVLMLSATYVLGRSVYDFARALHTLAATTFPLVLSVGFIFLAVLIFPDFETELSFMPFVKTMRDWIWDFAGTSK